jgi:P4 family phage/plasmid primase-like protien
METNVEEAVRSASTNEATNDPHRLSRTFITNRGTDSGGKLTLRFWRNEWWRFQAGCYQVVPDAQLRGELTTEIKQAFDQSGVTDKEGFVFKVGKSLVNNVMQALAGDVLVPDSTEQPAWLDQSERPRTFLSVENGLLDTSAAIAGSQSLIVPTTPHWFSSVCLPVRYEAGADCPRFLQFLREMFDGDAERTAVIQEWLGYNLIALDNRQKFLVLEGDGANGKTVLLDVLTNLLGPSNVSHVPLEMFAQRFQLTVTLGKLANIVSEVGEIDRVAEGTLKAFTSRDRMYFDRKGIPGVQAYPTAKLILATNNRPRFYDRSSGIWRRMILVPCDVIVPPGRQDPKLGEKLCAELPGILNFALNGLRRLHTNAGFTTSAICAAALDEYRIESNPERQFLKEHYEPNVMDSVPSGEMYEAYQRWCGSNGYKAINAGAFGKDVYRAFPTIQKVRGSAGLPKKRCWIYSGVHAVSMVTKMSKVA